jgi:hypothetical protein
MELLLIQEIIHHYILKKMKINIKRILKKGLIRFVSAILFLVIAFGISYLVIHYKLLSTSNLTWILMILLIPYVIFVEEKFVQKIK